MTGKVRKVKLADVLWDAANEHLWDGDWPRDHKDSYSCCAIATASECVGLRHDAAKPFVESLGCPWENYAPSMVDQSVRYLWLLLAMHVAADEGIEIEVQA